METTLLVAAVLLAGVACPAVMWWRGRSGREAACCLPRDTRDERRNELAELRMRNEALSAHLAELRGDHDRVGAAAGGNPDG